MNARQLIEAQDPPKDSRVLGDLTPDERVGLFMVMDDDVNGSVYEEDGIEPDYGGYDQGAVDGALGIELTDTIDKLGGYWPNAAKYLDDRGIKNKAPYVAYESVTASDVARAATPL